MTTLERLRWWHLDDVLALEREAFAPEDWSAETWWGELVPDRGRYLTVLLEAGERVIGYAGLAQEGGDGHVMTIAVAAAARGRGLGAVLLADLLDEAGQQGLHHVGLEVREHNDVAQSLYARAGFRVIGRRRRYYPATGEDALVMRCDSPTAAVAALLS